MSNVILNIAIIGAPNSGKRSLSEKIAAYTVYRNGTTFSFRGHINGNSAAPGPDIDFALALMRSDEPYFMLVPSQSLVQARELASISRTCVVGTMRDTIPADYSDMTLIALSHPTRVPHFQGTPYFPVNCLNGHGLGALCEYIVDAVTGSPRPRRMTMSSYFDHLTTYLLDVIASVFALPVPSDVNQDKPDCEDLDDETVLQMVESPIAETWRESLKARIKVDIDASRMPTHQITPTLIVKGYHPHEKAAIEYVRRHTRIPVPQLYNRDLEWWMVSDLIEGEMLSECWEKQSMFMKFRIGCTIRTYLAQLRGLRGTVPGSVFDHTSSGPFFDETNQGPFRSVLDFQRRFEMIAFFGWQSLVTHYQRYNMLDKIEPQPAIPGEPWELVFAHGDLNDTNMILSKDGTLWIIDWAESGFYPTWFDGAAMARYDDRPRSWQLMRLFAAGKHADAMYTHFWKLVLNEIHCHQ